MGLFKKKKLSDEETIRRMIYEIEDDITREERKLEEEKLAWDKKRFTRFWIEEGGKDSPGALLLREDTQNSLAQRAAGRREEGACQNQEQDKEEKEKDKKDKERERLQKKVDDLTSKIAWRIWKQQQGRCHCGQEHDLVVCVQEATAETPARKETDQKTGLPKSVGLIKNGTSHFKHLVSRYVLKCPQCRPAEESCQN